MFDYEENKPCVSYHVLKYSNSTFCYLEASSFSRVLGSVIGKGPNPQHFA